MLLKMLTGINCILWREASKPSQEANKQVQGEGNTSLESTVIRWYLDSAPKGADISLRIVSSTPEVKIQIKTM